MITEEDAPKTKEEKIKNYLEIITDRIPKIISMAEEDDFTTFLPKQKRTNAPNNNNMNTKPDGKNQGNKI